MFRAAILTCALTLCPAALTAQAVTSSTEADSVQLRILTVQVLLDTLAPVVSGSDRIWLGSGALFRGAASAARYAISDAEAAAIAGAFRGARRAGPRDELFLCPEGVELRLPGSPCPIREGGVVVELGPLRFDGDSVLTTGWIVRSSTPRGNLITWAEILSLVFERSCSGWRLRAIRSRAIT
jgi:hypothetical protein